MIIGIDLGTTFSVIAIKGQAQLVPGYPKASYLEAYDVSIIPDEYGNYLIPSAVWEAPESPGILIVGADAKSAADEGNSPMMFFKRDIGTNIQHSLGERHFSAQDASREVLIYLKRIAELALGHVIEQAVITHPAYFDPAMIEETAEAAKAAGFRVDPEEHLLQEPTAAAIAYLHDDQRDPLRILTYDLGGGTFDVTTLERRGGLPVVKKYGGNRLLGGFNFDRLLAEELLNRMRERGVRITLDDNNLEDRGKWAKLLRIAEDTKIKLSRARTPMAPVPIKEPLFADDDGHTITLTDKVTQQEFVGLIQPLLNETIYGQGESGTTKGCLKTMAESGWLLEQLDEDDRSGTCPFVIILVGGSCAGPWVIETVERELRKAPHCDCESDFCVAVGAALKAASVEAEGSGGRIDDQLEMNVPSHSASELLTLGGRLLTGEDKTQSKGLQAFLDISIGPPLQTPVSSEGHFSFGDVELEPETVNHFKLMIIDEQGRTVTEREFKIEQSYDAGARSNAPAILTVLPKPLFVEVKGGLKPLAPEGTTLPAHFEDTFSRTNDLPEIEVQLFQESEPIGKVIITDIPPEAGPGSKVKLAVDISRNNRITGRATVHTRSGAAVAEGPVNVRIPPLTVPDLRDLEADFRILRSDLEERIAVERDTNTKVALRSEGDTLVEKIQALLDTPFADSQRQEIWLTLLQFRRIVHPARVELSPPKSAFDDLVQHLRWLLHEHSTDPQIQAYATMIDKSMEEAELAYDRKDQRAWGQHYNALLAIHARLTGSGGSRSETAPPPPRPTAAQKRQALSALDAIYQALDEAKSELECRNRLDRLKYLEPMRDTATQLEAELERIDDLTDPQTTQYKIADIMLRADALAMQADNLGGGDVTA